MKENSSYARALVCWILFCVLVGIVPDIILDWLYYDSNVQHLYSTLPVTRYYVRQYLYFSRSTAMIVDEVQRGRAYWWVDFVVLVLCYCTHVEYDGTIVQEG